MTVGEIIDRRLAGIKTSVDAIIFGCGAAAGRAAMGNHDNGLAAARAAVRAEVDDLFDQLDALARFITTAEGEVEGRDHD
ncbi:MAG: hypothetical protein IH904_05080 [Proteobacteria bacterium]|nr:hypothetical protein [Pseudomonadota bacterium]